MACARIYVNRACREDAARWLVCFDIDRDCLNQSRRNENLATKMERIHPTKNMRTLAAISGSLPLRSPKSINLNRTTSKLVSGSSVTQKNSARRASGVNFGVQAVSPPPRPVPIISERLEKVTGKKPAIREKSARRLCTMNGLTLVIINGKFFKMRDDDYSYEVILIYQAFNPYYYLLSVTVKIPVNGYK